MSTDPTTKMMQELALRKALNNSPTLLDRAKAINFSGVKPAVIRFAGRLGQYLPKSLPSWGRNLPAVGKNVPILNTALGTGMGVYNLSEGQNPVDAFGRPLFQIGGSVLGGIAGGAIGAPTGPGAFVPLNAGRIGGWYGGGEVYDALRGLTNTDTTAQEEGLRVIDDGSQTGVPVTEGVGTKLVRMPDGTVIRVPIETEIGDSTVISQDGIPVNEVIESEGKTISDKVGDFLDRADWESSRRSRNSPAARSGAFTSEQLRRQKNQHEDWKEARRSGTLADFAEQYPQSQTAKEYAIRKRIPSSLDMEF